MNLDKTPKVDHSLRCISAKDTDFEKSVREIHDIALTSQLLPAPITENRGICIVFNNQPATLKLTCASLNPKIDIDNIFLRDLLLQLSESSNTVLTANGMLSEYLLT